MSNLVSKEKTKSSKPNITSRLNKFLTEFAKEKSIINKFTSNGVWLVGKGSKSKLNYSGLLVNSGAQDVYAVISYGNNDTWKDVKYYHMDKIDDKTFEVLLPYNEKQTLNVCFKDSINNWDNNSGRNYSF